MAASGGKWRRLAASGGDAATFERYREAELLHARCALLGTAGCLGQQILLEQSWSVLVKAGASIFADTGLDYLGNLVSSTLNPSLLFWDPWSS